MEIEDYKFIDEEEREEYRYAVREALRDKELYRAIKRIVNKLIENIARNPEGPIFRTFLYDEVGTHWRTLKKLEKMGVIYVVSKTNTKTYYGLKSLKIVKEELENFEKYKEYEKSDIKVKSENINIDELFECIGNYDDLKRIIKKILKKKARAHILFVGPPATAKTLFLLEILKLPGTEYILGGSTSKVGFYEILFEKHPEIILIDEIDKMDRDTFSSLLSLMETGIVKEAKHGKHREIKLNSIVFAACNDDRKLPKELKDRFLKFYLKEYSDEEFIRVTEKVLVEQENVDRELARYIAQKILNINKSIRDAIKIAKICDCKEDVDDIIVLLKKYGRRW